MCLQCEFELTAGSIPGRRHVGSGNLLTGKNNQDAFLIMRKPDAIIALVLDGCGSGPHSEVGAKLAAPIIADAIYWAYENKLLMRPENTTVAEWEWECVRQAIVRKLFPIVESMSNVGCNSFTTVVHDFFLFTIIGALITDELTTIFSIGDGAYCLNGAVVELGPYDNNAPPYFSYALLDRQQPGAGPKFSIDEMIETTYVKSLMLGTDGALSLVHNEHAPVPGKSKSIGPIDQLWQDDKFFDGTDGELLTPWLRQLNSEVVKLVSDVNGARLWREYGLLQDDTTLVVMRRAKAEERRPCQT